MLNICTYSTQLSPWVNKTVFWHIPFHFFTARMFKTYWLQSFKGKKIYIKIYLLLLHVFLYLFCLFFYVVFCFFHLDIIFIFCINLFHHFISYLFFSLFPYIKFHFPSYSSFQNLSFIVTPLDLFYSPSIYSSLPWLILLPYDFLFSLLFFSLLIYSSPPLFILLLLD